MYGTTVFIMGSVLTAGASAQQSTPLLVFNGVTVVDVEKGKLVPNQRVVIAGNRIRKVDNIDAVESPKAGQIIVDAEGKYLIPGLWDMHTHARRYKEGDFPLRSWYWSPHW